MESKQEVISKPDRDWEIVRCGFAQNNENKPEQQYVHSVRRLSDSVVFSVGDEVGWGEFVLPIHDFKIKDGIMWANCYRDKILGAVVNSPLQELIPQPSQKPQPNMTKGIIYWQEADGESYEGKYTKQQVDELCEAAFNAARELIFGGKITGYEGESIKYSSYQSYKNNQSEVQSLKQEVLFVDENIKGCGICGGKLSLIRGKYPGHDKREVCPTCTTERLEQINEISSKDYGVAYQEKK